MRPVPWGSHTLWKFSRTRGIWEEKESRLEDSTLLPSTTQWKGVSFYEGSKQVFSKFRTKDISMTIKEKMTPGPWEALKK